jgi:hypothetical protein
MKTLVKVQEVENEGLIGLLGQEVMIFCLSYIYAGTLSGVNDEYVKLDNAKIVYETGAFDKKGYTDAQSLPQDTIYIMKKNIESFGHGK